MGHTVSYRTVPATTPPPLAQHYGVHGPNITKNLPAIFCHRSYVKTPHTSHQSFCQWVKSHLSREIIVFASRVKGDKNGRLLAHRKVGANTYWYQETPHQALAQQQMRAVMFVLFIDFVSLEWSVPSFWFCAFHLYPKNIANSHVSCPFLFNHAPWPLHNCVFGSPCPGWPDIQIDSVEILFLFY